MEVWSHSTPSKRLEFNAAAEAFKKAATEAPWADMYAGQDIGDMKVEEWGIEGRDKEGMRNMRKEKIYFVVCLFEDCHSVKVYRKIQLIFHTQHFAFIIKSSRSMLFR